MYDKDAQLIFEAYKSQLDEGVLRQAGHITLDVLGFIPGLGEFADLTNAIWHAKHGEYFMALMSIISLVPVVGDAVGKSGKVVRYLAKVAKLLKGTGKVGRLGAKGIVKGRKVLVRAAPKAKHLQNIVRANQAAIHATLDSVEENKYLRSHMPEIRRSMDEFVANGRG